MTTEINYREDFSGCLDIDLTEDLWMLIEGDRAADVFIGETEGKIKLLPGGFRFCEEWE